MSDSYQEILERLAIHGIAYEILTHPPLFTMADVDRELDVRRDARIKSVVVSDRSDTLTICGIHEASRLDLGAVAKVLGTPRSGLRLAPSDLVERELGVPAGAIGLVPPRHTPTLVADTFCDEGDVYFGSGRNDRTIRASLEAIVGAFEVRRASIERR